MSGWQPIETAPRDGSGLLLWDGVDSAHIGFWNGRTWDDGDFHDDMGSFTHWMPLPAPPVSA